MIFNGGTKLNVHLNENTRTAIKMWKSTTQALLEKVIPWQGKEQKVIRWARDARARSITVLYII